MTIRALILGAAVFGLAACGDSVTVTEIDAEPKPALRLHLKHLIMPLQSRMNSQVSKLKMRLGYKKMPRKEA